MISGFFIITTQTFIVAGDNSEKELSEILEDDFKILKQQLQQCLNQPGKILNTRLMIKD